MNYKHLLETLLFSSPEPINQKKFNEILDVDEVVDMKALVDELNDEYVKLKKGLMVKKISGGYQILTDPMYHHYIEKMFIKKKKMTLSRPALEALSIIAYKQPIIRSEIESIRGVDCGGVIKTLMERNFIKVRGRSKSPGRPLLFCVTKQFLESFGLNKISDLPKLRELTELMKDDENLELFPNENAVE